MNTFYLHPLLRYHQHPVAPGHCCPLVWDMRDPPTCARRVVNPTQSITSFHLSRLAANPPLTILNITSDLFPSQDWSIQVRRLQGITVHDILNAIHSSLMQPIHPTELNDLSDKQRNRIQLMFEKRCKFDRDEDQCRARGPLRVDFLSHHTLFAGLTVSLVQDCSCILTLRRLPKYYTPPPATSDDT